MGAHNNLEIGNLLVFALVLRANAMYHEKEHTFHQFFYLFA